MGAGRTGRARRLAAWLARRARGGFVRRAHGDLHLGNLCLWQGRPVLFDALEFDERDGDHRSRLRSRLPADGPRPASRRAAANRVLNRYVARTGDAPLTRGLPALPVAARDGAGARAGDARQCRRWPTLSRRRPGVSASGAADRGGHRRPAGHRQIDAGAARWRRSWARARRAGAAQRRDPQAPARRGAGARLPPRRLRRRRRARGPSRR